MSLLDNEEELIENDPIYEKYILDDWLKHTGSKAIMKRGENIRIVSDMIKLPRFISEVYEMNEIITNIPDIQKKIYIEYINVTYGAGYSQQKTLRANRKIDIDEIYNFRILLPRYETSVNRLVKISNYEINKLVDLKDIHVNKIQNLSIEFPYQVITMDELRGKNLSNLTESLPNADELIKCYIDIIDAPYTIHQTIIFDMLDDLKGINCNELQIYIDSNINKRDFEKGIRRDLNEFFNNNKVNTLRLMFANSRHIYFGPYKINADLL